MQHRWIRRVVAVAVMALTFGLVTVGVTLADDGGDGDGDLKTGAIARPFK